MNDFNFRVPAGLAGLIVFPSPGTCVSVVVAETQKIV